MSDQDIKQIAEEMSMKARDNMEIGDTVPELLNWNNLAYTMPITNSVTSARNMKEYRPQRREYEIVKNDTIVITVQTGAQYVDWSQSYLTFDFEIETTDALVTASPDSPFMSADAVGDIKTDYDQRDLQVSDAGHIGPQTTLSGLVVSETKGVLESEYKLLQTLHSTDGKSRNTAVMNATPELWTNWGYGSCLNLFQTIVVTSRSGVELMRTENFNRMSVARHRVKQSPGWFETTGIEMGYEPISEQTQFDEHRGQIIAPTACGQMVSPATFSASALKSPFRNKKSQFIWRKKSVIADPSVKSNKISFSIPMESLGGLFANDQLCPAALCSGMRIEIRLEDLKSAICSWGMWKSTLATAKYSASCVLPTAITSGLKGTMSNIKLNCDTHLLNDAAMRELNRTSAQNGLEYVYTATYSQTTPVNQGTIESTVAKSVSRAISTFGGCYKLMKSDTSVDNFKTAPPDEVAITQYQWRLGSMYYPHAPFESYSQFYSNLMYSLGEFNEGKCDLSPSEYRSLLSLFSATFERSNLLRFSGVPINNSRTLSCAAEFVKPDNRFGGTTSSFVVSATPLPANKYEVIIWLEYVSLAKAFLNNVVVSV